MKFKAHTNTLYLNAGDRSVVHIEPNAVRLGRGRFGEWGGLGRGRFGEGVVWGGSGLGRCVVWGGLQNAALVLALSLVLASCKNGNLVLT